MAKPVQDHKTVNQDGYEITFHPAFAGRCAVQTGSKGETEMYRQEEVHHLPKGQTEPPTQHRIEFRGGKHEQDFALQIDDPNHRIARITVELYDQKHEPGWGKGEKPVETVVVDNDSQHCPPHCPPSE